ncbi:hypothetical protein AC579_220 [Pseudocercospora musae]|uniref:HD domain-containing protein n=1 Tax=Pseudocercospora musae TaxID=113226 RepID=A0A139I9I7_9PEZI|nr:hypothetical protein AC579_220 [Pseudocercospora musae]
MCSPSSHPERSSNTFPPQDIISLIPAEPMYQAAYQHAVQELHPSILKHSLRTYLYASKVASQESLPHSRDAHLRTLLFIVCIFHDIGTSETYNTGPVRFEIEGADAAVKFLIQYPEEFSEADKQDVWTAIAVHDAPQIAERISPLARLVRLGVLIDFKRGDGLEMVSPCHVDETERLLPRHNIEKYLGDAIVAQAVRCPEKAPRACWPGGLYRAHLEDPGREGVNKAF